jgi:pimeloyl-ACP methyl ester carboxylesterase
MRRGHSIHRWATRAVLGALLVLALLTAAGSAWQAIASATDLSRLPGRMVQVGSLKLQLYCTGRGGPTVIFDSGLGQTMTDWQLVQPAVARRTTACSYDRAGLGRSDADPGPRDASRLADQFDWLLHAAAVPRPYILVGHSLGGLTLRLFAARHGADVAGLALIDAASPTDDTALPAQVLAQQRAEFAPTDLCSGVSVTARVLRMIGWSRLTFSADPADPRLPASWRQVEQTERRRWIDGLSAPCAEGYAEEAALPESEREAGLVTTLGSLPLAVVSRGIDETWAPPVPIAATERAWHAEQAVLTQLSTDVRWTIASQARHYVMLDQPQAVIDAVDWLLAQRK